MITLKTTTKKDFNSPHGVNIPINDFIYLKIDRPIFFGNAVAVEGYYYYFEDGEPTRLRDINITPIDRATLSYLQENVIPKLNDENLFNLMEYLAYNLAIMKLQEEAQTYPGANYGITGNGDIEIYTEE